MYIIRNRYMNIFKFKKKRSYALTTFDQIIQNDKYIQL